MKRSRFTEEQIVGMLKGQGAGMSTADLCRKRVVGSATLYKFKARNGRLAVADARRLKAPEDENAELKKLLAEAILNNAVLKDDAAKKMVASGGRRASCRESPLGGRAPACQTARRVTGWDEIGPQKADMLRNVIRENFRAILLEGERR